jgi:hypothetical protein
VTGITGQRHYEIRDVGAGRWEVIDATALDRGEEELVAHIIMVQTGFEVTSSHLPGIRSFFPTLAAALRFLETAPAHHLP